MTDLLGKENLILYGGIFVVGILCFEFYKAWKNRSAMPRAKRTLGILAVSIAVCAVCFFILPPRCAERTKLLWEAVKNNDADRVGVLIQEWANVNAEDNKGWTPLMMAAGYAQTSEVVNLLLDAGAKVDPKSKNTETPLMWAVANRHDNALEIVNILLDAGANVDAKNWREETPLIRAARYARNPEIVRVLLRAGADVNAKTRSGVTPLAQAAKYTENTEIVKVLLEAGADVGARDSIRTTPLMAGAHSPRALEVVKILLRAGADVNAKDKTGGTPLTYAMANTVIANVDVVLRVGLDAIANADSKDKEKMMNKLVTQWADTPRHPRNSEVMKALIRAGANVDAKNDEGMTPLMAAAKYYGRNPEYMTVLLDAGADTEAKDKKGRKAIDYAEENEYLQNTDVLRRLESLTSPTKRKKSF
ncbi:MAG: ankyrin repeat domain-containing protein [Synergistaceae bacterium]|nr:ankyrin repeat domain-containing protein [Synergistaceae bacterium]